MIERLASIGPGASELGSLPGDVMDAGIHLATGLFRQHKFCMPVGYNLKRINVFTRDVEGWITSGSLEWAVEVKPFEAEYTKTAFVDVSFDADMVRAPALFRDHQGQARGFSEVSLRRFLYAGADLSEHIPPFLSRI